MFLFLFGLCQATYVNWTVQWSAFAPDSFPRPAIVITNTSLASTYNDVALPFATFGGPTLYVDQGDTVELCLLNKLVDGVVSLHFHGLHMLHNVAMDGVGGITQAAILPMHTFCYRFEITQPPGTHFYHSHSGLQSSDGMQGAIVIRSPTSQFAREYVITLQDWTHELATTLFTKYTARNDAFRGFAADYPYPAVSILINGVGQFNCTSQLVSHQDCDLVRRFGWRYLTTNESMPLKNTSFETNGQCNPNRAPFLAPCANEQRHSTFQCEPGSTNLLRLIGAGFSLGLRFWVDAHKLIIVAKDGLRIHPMETDAVFLHSGERLDVAIHCDQNASQNYFMFAAVAYEYYGKQAHLKSPNVSSYAILEYTPDAQPAVAKLPPHAWPQASIGPVYFYPQPNNAAQSATERFLIWSQSKGNWWNYESNVSGKRLEWWEMNDYAPFAMPQNMDVLKACATGKNFTTMFGRMPLILRLTVNQTYEFVLANNESQPHPWHIHGYSVDVIQIGRLDDLDFYPQNESFSGTMRADTFVVPSKSYVQFRIFANNPGPWLVHCHMPYHSEVGMAFLLSVEFEGKECAYQQFTPSGNFEMSWTRLIVIVTIVCFVPLCTVSFALCLKRYFRIKSMRKIGVLNGEYTQDVALSSNFRVNPDLDKAFQDAQLRRRCCCC